MDKKECKIIQDLLPNYIENLTSLESNEFIETHLTYCKECKKSLDIMKKEIAIDNKKASKQINYLKRYRRKMTILKSVIAVALILILVFLGFKIYQWQFLLKVYNHNVNYEIGNNYKFITKSGTYTQELIYKDGNGYLKVNKDAGYWEDSNTKYMLLLNDKKYLVLDKFEGPIGMADSTISIGAYILLGDVENFNLFKSVLTTNFDIHEEEYGTHQCYVILFDGHKIWVDKETMFILRQDYEGQTTEFFVEIGTVTDKDIALPDLSNYTEIKR